MLRQVLVPLIALSGSAVAWAQDPDPKPQPTKGSEFNPTITVVGNMLWRLDNRKVFLENDPTLDRIDDKFSVREVELDFRASVDPHADAFGIFALEAEVPGSYEISVEELYLVIKKLPFGFWESPPLGTKIKLGRWRVDYGHLNRLHLHDLPQSFHGLTVQNFLGEEGYVANGVQTQSFLTSLGEGGVLQLQLNAYTGGGAEYADAKDVPNLHAVLQAFFELGEAMSLDLNFGLHYGGVAGGTHQRHARSIYVDGVFKWKPKRQGEWTSFVMGASVIRAERSFVLEEDIGGDGVTDFFKGEESSPMGFLVWGQYQLDRRWYVGARYDRSDFIDEDDSDHSRITGYVSCYLSEFFRARWSVERTTSDLPTEDDLTTFLFEVNVIYGAHPPHPFWVNR